MKIFFCVLLLCWSVVGTAEQNLDTSLELKDIIQKQSDANNTSLKILTGWGATSLVSGLALEPSFQDNESKKYFYEMNAIYGAINLSIGIVGLIINKNESQETVANSREVLKRGLRFERIYWVNAGIDLGMVMLGVALRNKTETDLTRGAKWDGYGQAFMLQGLFLLFLDTIMAIHHSNITEDWIDSPRFAFTPTGIAFRF